MGGRQKEEEDSTTGSVSSSMEVRSEIIMRVVIWLFLGAAINFFPVVPSLTLVRMTQYHWVPPSTPAIY